jgi:flagellar biosynthesis protein FlhG
MKTFENENYYRILQVRPNASTDEIRHAYRDALALYEDESVATYSLFTEGQRKGLLQAIETAFATLTDEEKRAAYDQMLIDNGLAAADDFSRQAQRKLAAYTDTRSTSKEESLCQWVSKKSNEPPIRQLTETLLAKELLSGPDLKQLREAYGIELPEIYAITKISSDILKMIEANRFDALPAKVYLKQFLKTYAELLRIDSQLVVDSYLKLMARDNPER